MSLLQSNTAVAAAVVFVALAVSCMALVYFRRHQQQQQRGKDGGTLGTKDPRGGMSVRTVLVTDGAEFTRFLWPAIRQAMYPHAVQFVTTAVEKPDMVLASLFGSNHTRYTGMPRILVIGEPHADMAKAQQFDVVFCDFRVPRTVYMPFWAMAFGERRLNVPADLLGPAPRYRKTKFCAFMYNHASEHRDAIFDIVSRYKRVDALGRAKNPAATSDSRGVDSDEITYHDIAVDMYRPYKFVIAGENTRKEGYVSEKIVSAMLAGCIPIYWGAPDIRRHFNPASFIDASKPGFMKLVRKLDRDPDAYAAMLRQPRLRGDRLPTKWFSATALARHIAPIVSA